MNPTRVHRGVSLVETLSVIVIIAALSPVLARLLSSASATHTDAASTRVSTTGARFALETLEARIGARLNDPAITITRLSASEVAFSDASGVELHAGAITWTEPGLPAGDLATGVDAFRLGYYDNAGQPLDPSYSELDESEIARITINLSVDGLDLRANVFREGLREYVPAASDHEGAWFENFDGLPNDSTDDDGETAWTTQLDGHSRADHGVHDGAYRFSITRPQGRPVVWLSESIDTSNLDSFAFACRLDGSGTLDRSGGYMDTLEITLIIDGVRELVYRGVGTEPVDAALHLGPYDGSSVQIEIAAQCTGTDEQYLIDDIAILPPAHSDIAVISQAGILSFDPGSQDGQGGFPTHASVIEDGRGIRLEGNAWKAIPFTYTVTEHTVMTFEFRTDALGELHTICFDDNLRYNGYELRDGPTPAGTQMSHGMRGGDVTPYTGDGDWQAYEIPLHDNAGDSVLGEWSYLVFLADDDRNGNCVTEFRNIRIFESESP